MNLYAVFVISALSCLIALTAAVPRGRDNSCDCGRFLKKLATNQLKSESLKKLCNLVVPLHKYVMHLNLLIP